MIGVTLTKDQTRALAEIAAAARPGERYLLTGYAGTGKTTLLQQFVREMRARGRSVVLTAPTHKAVAVLSRKLHEAGILGVECRTIHSLLSLKPKAHSDRQIFVRDKRAEPVMDDAVVIDECFVAGTLVDTPMGSRPIEELRPGDLILNAYGVDRVVATIKKEAGRIARVHAAEKTITSSESHRFFTRRGLIRAADLLPGDYLLPITESMRRLWGRVPAEERLDKALLLRELRDALVPQLSRTESKKVHTGARGEGRCWPKEILGIKRPKGRRADRPDTQPKPDRQRGCTGKDFSQVAGDGTQAEDQGRQRARPHGSTGGAAWRSWNALEVGVCNQDRTAPEGVPVLLQNRPSGPGEDDCGRGRRIFSHGKGETGAGPQERGVSSWIRVDGVEVLEPGSPGLDQYRDADGKLYLYDLQAERHASFSVEGALVHNCSMVSIDLFVHIKRHLPASFVLFVGDPAQLPPVGEVASQTFATKRRSHLDTIVRQAAGNPVLAAAHAIRSSQGGPMDWSWCKPSPAGQCGVFVPRDPAPWLQKAFTSADFDADPDRFRYLAWTNQRVAEINQQIRLWRYGDGAITPFMPGERALVRQPIVRDGTILFSTNEEADVLAIWRGEFRFPINTIRETEGWIASIPSWVVTLRGADELPHEVHMIADERAYNRVLARITDEATDCRGRWEQFHEFKSAMARLQAVYAMTIHTSQGSTFRNVFLDVADIQRRADSNVLETQQLAYVAATRPSHALMLVGAL